MSQDVLSIIASFFGSFGFAIIYNIRGRRVLIPAIGGAVFWAVYLVFLHFVNNEYLGFFVVAILITIYSEIWARILKTPATTVLMYFSFISFAHFRRTSRRFFCAAATSSPESYASQSLE